MNIAVYYFTRSGNTKKLAEAVGGALGVEAREVSEKMTEKADIVFLGNSMYGAGVDEAVVRFVKENAVNIGKIVNLSTAAVASSTYKLVKKLAAENGVEMADEEFHCRGSFLFMHRNRPNEADLKNAVSFAKNIVKKYQEE